MKHVYKISVCYIVALAMPQCSLVVTGFAVHQMIASAGEKLALKQQRMAALKELSLKQQPNKGRNPCAFSRTPELGQRSGLTSSAAAK